MSVDRERDFADRSDRHWRDRGDAGDRMTSGGGGGGRRGRDWGNGPVDRRRSGRGDRDRGQIP